MKNAGVVRSAGRVVFRAAGSPTGSLAVFGVGVLTLAGLLVVVAQYFSDDLRCPADGQESNYGDAAWSWFPLGTTCRWTEARNGFDRVEDPGWLPTVLIAGMVLVGIVLLAAAVRSRSGAAMTRSGG